MKIGDRIRSARNFKGLSIDELAASLKVTRETVRGWEKHIAEPRPQKYPAIAKALGVDEPYLVLGVKDAYAKKEGSESPSELERLFDNLSRDQKEAVVALLRSMTS